MRDDFFGSLDVSKARQDPPLIWSIITFFPSFYNRVQVIFYKKGRDG